MLPSAAAINAQAAMEAFLKVLLLKRAALVLAQSFASENHFDSMQPLLDNLMFKKMGPKVFETLDPTTATRPTGRLGLISRQKTCLHNLRETASRILQGEGCLRYQTWHPETLGCRQGIGRTWQPIDHYQPGQC